MNQSLSYDSLFVDERLTRLKRSIRIEIKRVDGMKTNRVTVTLNQQAV